MSFLAQCVTLYTPTLVVCTVYLGFFGIMLAGHWLLQKTGRKTGRSRRDQTKQLFDKHRKQSLKMLHSDLDAVLLPVLAEIVLEYVPSMVDEVGNLAKLREESKLKRWRQCKLRLGFAIALFCGITLACFSVAREIRAFMFLGTLPGFSDWQNFVCFGLDFLNSPAVLFLPITACFFVLATSTGEQCNVSLPKKLENFIVYFWVLILLFFVGPWAAVYLVCVWPYIWYPPCV